MTHLDLFSGIGGFALAASWVWEDHQVAAFCERDAYCQKILQKHWPDVLIHDDITTMDGKPYAGTIDLLTGGFPCQPFSSASAGKRTGTMDDRYLWPKMLRIVSEVRPRWVLAENVTHIDGMALELVVSDLESIGYEVAPPLEIPACAVGCDHRRSRIWICGHANCDGKPGVPVDAKASWLPQSRYVAGSMGATHGISRGMDRVRRSQRLGGLGNAIAPKVAAEIFAAIKTADQVTP